MMLIFIAGLSLLFWNWKGTLVLCFVYERFSGTVCTSCHRCFPYLKVMISGTVCQSFEPHCNISFTRWNWWYASHFQLRIWKQKYRIGIQKINTLEVWNVRYTSLTQGSVVQCLRNSITWDLPNFCTPFCRAATNWTESSSLVFKLAQKISTGSILVRAWIEPSVGLGT